MGIRGLIIVIMLTIYGQANSIVMHCSINKKITQPYIGNVTILLAVNKIILLNKDDQFEGILNTPYLLHEAYPSQGGLQIRYLTANDNQFVRNIIFYNPSKNELSIGTNAHFICKGVKNR